MNHQMVSKQVMTAWSTASFAMAHISPRRRFKHRCALKSGPGSVALVNKTKNQLSCFRTLNGIPQNHANKWLTCEVPTIVQVGYVHVGYAHVGYAHVEYAKLHHKGTTPWALGEIWSLDKGPLQAFNNDLGPWLVLGRSQKALKTLAIYFFLRSARRCILVLEDLFKSGFLGTPNLVPASHEDNP